MTQLRGCHLPAWGLWQPGVARKAVHPRLALGGAVPGTAEGKSPHPSWMPRCGDTGAGQTHMLAAPGKELGLSWARQAELLASGDSVSPAPEGRRPGATWP